jgi:(p)ppGpp synthase/HD superfamily hydrolase
MEKFLSERVLMALRFAAIAHREQRRKDRFESPYISHPAAVGMILGKAGANDDVVCAGIMHDVIEDTKFSYENIEKGFGSSVADLVKWVSENKDLEFLERKESYLVNLANAPMEARMISAADLLANRVDMLALHRQGEDIWSKFTWGAKDTFSYDRRRIGIIKELVKHPFVEELEGVVRELEGLFLENNCEVVGELV